MKKLLIFISLTIAVSVFADRRSFLEGWNQQMRDYYKLYSGGDNIDEKQLSICRTILIQCLTEVSFVHDKTLEAQLGSTCFAEARVCVGSIYANTIK